MLGDVVFLTISIPAPREGCDSLLVCTRSACVPFQSTHPARGATRGWVWCSPRRRNFNPRTPRGVRRPEPQRLKPMSDFNPRTPRGVRPPTKGIMLGGFFISIHAPREGCDSRCPQPELPKTQFQSTHPARGATRISTHCCVTCTFQSTHPARGATSSPSSVDRWNEISIHAPREGCDGRCWTMAWSSTVIPIHAPREGCDPGGRACTGLLTDFNPRTPRGVRRPGAGRLHHQMPISIHAPREGCDLAHR